MGHMYHMATRYTCFKGGPCWFDLKRFFYSQLGTHEWTALRGDDGSWINIEFAISLDCSTLKREALGSSVEIGRRREMPIKEISLDLLKFIRTSVSSSTDILLDAGRCQPKSVSKNQYEPLF